jgi:hypothetical protein
MAGSIIMFTKPRFVLLVGLLFCILSSMVWLYQSPYRPTLETIKTIPILRPSKTPFEVPSDAQLDLKPTVLDADNGVQPGQGTKFEGIHNLEEFPTVTVDNEEVDDVGAANHKTPAVGFGGGLSDEALKAMKDSAPKASTGSTRSTTSSTSSASMGAILMPTSSPSASSMSSPTKAAAKPAATPAAAESHSRDHWRGWDAIDHLFLFGDSYTSTAFDHMHTQPAPQNPMGNMDV